MRKFLLVFIAVVSAASGFAQKSADIGIWGGSSGYIGDIKNVPPVQSFNLNIGALFRYNFNTRAGLRVQFLSGSFGAEGLVEDESFSFEKNAQDISVMMEINYLKYLLGEKKTRFTPYIMGGVGIMYFPYNHDPSIMALINPRYPVQNVVEEPVIAGSIPFGFGVKFTVGERLGVGAEVQMRKLLNDKFDNLDDPYSFEKVNEGITETVKYTDFLHNNDWPAYMGINLTYRINLNPRACPAYDRKYW